MSDDEKAQPPLPEWLNEHYGMGGGLPEEETPPPSPITHEQLEQMRQSLARMQSQYERMGASIVSGIRHMADELERVAIEYKNRPTREQLIIRTMEWEHARENNWIDNGEYGPQSPDLIADYIQRVHNMEGWRFPESYAGQFLATEDEYVREHFYRLDAAHTGAVGDIAVFKGPAADDFGIIGVITKAWDPYLVNDPAVGLRAFRRLRNPSVEIFTQSPIFPPGQLPLPLHHCLGGWRPKVRY